MKLNVDKLQKELYPELKKHQDGGLLYPKVNQLINRTNQKNID